MSEDVDAAFDCEPEARRFLLTGVYSHYHFEPTWDRPELASDLATMVELFTNDFGYKHVPMLGLDATWLQTKDSLRDFALDPDRRPDDYVVLYLAGHGEVIPVGQTGFEHILLPADATPQDLRRRAVKSADLAEWLLADTAIRRLLVVVDACYSGHGALDFARNALANLGRPQRFEDSDGSGVVVVTASRPAERAVAGAFTAGFARAVRHQASAGHRPEQMSIAAVLSVLKVDPALPASQSATWSLLLGEGSIPYFLPNPRHDATFESLDLAEQARQWQARIGQEHRRAEELRTRFVPKSSSFIGRSAALAYLTKWLHDPLRTDCVVVTGDPGSGKTAVLGLLASLSDGSQRPTVSTAGIADTELPGEDALDAAIYAGGLSATAVLTGIAAAAGLEDLDPDPAALDDFINQLLSTVGSREGTLTVLIDALDEADDPTQLAECVIRPLIERGRGSLRFLLGTRREILSRLGRSWRQQYSVVDLDSEEYGDLASISILIRRTLKSPVHITEASVEESPFMSAPTVVVDGVVNAIAAVARSSFFVATIVAATQSSLAAKHGLPDFRSQAWLDSLPHQSGEAMRSDLETRLGGAANKAMELLLPLAYARGVELPWEDMWVLLANALFPDRHYTNNDLTWLRYRAGSYVVEGGTVESRSLYRLFHQSLAEYMLSDRDRVADEQVIFRALRAHVPPRPDGKPDWWAAHPYLRLHLAQHADAARLVDELTEEPGYLAAAEPSHLLAALDSSKDEGAQTAALAYRRAAAALRRYSEKDRIAYLALAARCVGAKELATRASAEDGSSTWWPHWTSWRQNRHHQRLDGHTGWVNALAAGEFNGRSLVVSASDDNTLRRWDLALGAEVGSPLRGHTGAVNIVVTAEHHGRRIIISAGDDCTIRLWDGESGTAVGSPLTGHTGWIRGLATLVMRNRSIIISASDDGTLRTWDLVSGRPLGSPLEGHSGPVRTVQVMDVDGHPIAVSAGDDGTLRRWDLTTHTAIGDPMLGHTGPAWPVAVTNSKGVPLAISGSYDTTVRVWDLRTGTAVGQPLSGHTGAVWCLAPATLRGRPVILSGAADATVRVWDLASHAAIGEPLTGHGDWVNALTAAELEGRPVIVSGSADRTLRVWDLTEEPGPADPFVGHGGPTRALAATTWDDRSVVVTGSDDTTVRIWDTFSGRAIGEALSSHTDWVRSVAAAEIDGQIVIASGGDDCTVQRWGGMSRPTAQSTLVGHRGSVWCVSLWAQDGVAGLASASADATVIIWDLVGGAPRYILRGHDGPVRAVATVIRDSRRVVVSAGDDSVLRLWDAATGEQIDAPLTGHKGAVWSVATAVLNGVPVAISGGQDATVRAWNLNDGSCIAIRTHADQELVRSVAAATVGGRLFAVAGGEGRAVTVWDVFGNIEQPTASIQHSASVWSVGVTAGPDGTPVAVAVGQDNAVRTWDLPRGGPVGDRYIGHAGPVLAVATAGDGDNRPVALTGSADGTIRIWERFSGLPLGEPLRGHEGPVRTISVTTEQGRQLAVSGGDNGDVRIWELAAARPLGPPLAGHTGAVLTSAAVTFEGKSYVFTAGLDAEVRMWRVTPPVECVAVMAGHLDSVHSLTGGFIEGRATVFSGGADGVIRSWDVASARPLGALAGHSGTVRSLALVPRVGTNAADLASVSDDGTLRLWDLPAGLSTSILTDPSRPIQCLCTLPPSHLAERVRLAVAAGDVISIVSETDAARTEWRTTHTVDMGSKILSMASNGEDGLLVTTELGVAAIRIR